MNARWALSAEKGKLKKGPWTFEEDLRLLRHIRLHGEGRWSALAKAAGLQRCGKSCRLRWVNYLRPDLKRGNITPEEEQVIIDLHARWGNRWSLIAERMPGRTDNEIKNYWRCHLKKKLQYTADNSNGSQYCNLPLSLQQEFKNKQTPTAPLEPHLQQVTAGNASVIYENKHCSASAGVELEIPTLSSSTPQEVYRNGSVITGNSDLEDTETDYIAQREGNTLSALVTGSEPIQKEMVGSELVDALPSILYRFPSGIPIEDDAARVLQVSSRANLNPTGTADPAHYLYPQYGCELEYSGLDMGSDIMLWNLCPSPAISQCELHSPFPYTCDSNTHHM